MADNVISVQVVADASSVKQTFEAMLANIRLSLEAVRAEIRKTAAQLELAAPEDKNSIKSALSALKWDSADLDAGLKRVAAEWSGIKNEITGALTQYLAFEDRTRERTRLGFPVPPEERVQAQGKVSEATTRLEAALAQALPLGRQTRELEAQARQSVLTPGSTVTRLAAVSGDTAKPKEEEKPTFASKEEEALAWARQHPQDRFQNEKSNQDQLQRRFGLDAEAAQRVNQSFLTGAPTPVPKEQAAKQEPETNTVETNRETSETTNVSRETTSTPAFAPSNEAEKQEVTTPKPLNPEPVVVDYSKPGFEEQEAEVNHRFGSGPELVDEGKAESGILAGHTRDAGSLVNSEAQPVVAEFRNPLDNEISVIQRQAQENVEAAKVVGETIATATQNGASSLEHAFAEIRNGNYANGGSNGGSNGGGGKPPVGPPPVATLPPDDNEEERSQKAARDAAIGIVNDNSIKAALDQKRDEYTRGSHELQAARRELESFSKSIPQNLPLSSPLRKIEADEALRISDLTERNAQLRQELTALERQYRAIAAAEEIAARQAQTLNALQRQATVNPPRTAEEAEGYRKRAQAEQSSAQTALRNAQTTLGGPAAQGSQEAQAGIDSLQQSVLASTQVVSQFKDVEDQLADSEKKAGDAAEAAGSGARALAGANNAAEAQSRRLAAIQEEVSSSVGASAAEMQGNYVRAATEARLATSNLEQAQKVLGDAAAAGDKEAAVAIQIYRNSLTQASAAADELKSRVILLTRAEADATEATMAEARAHVEQATAEAGSAAAALKLADAEAAAGRGANNFGQRVNEGRVILGAAEGRTGALSFALARLGAVSQTLGPIIDAAFAPFLVIGLGEVILDVGKKVKDLYDNFVLLKDVREATEQVELKLAKATEQAFLEERKLSAELLRQQGKNAEAAKLDRETLESKSIDLQPYLNDKEIEKKFKSLPDAVQKSLQEAYSDIIPAQLPDKIAQLKKQYDEAASAAAKLREEQKALANRPPGFITANDLSGIAGNAGVSQLVERDANKAENTRDLYGGLLQYLNQKLPAVETERKVYDQKEKEEQGRDILKNTQRQEDELKESTAVTGVLPPSIPTATPAPERLPFAQTPGGAASLPNLVVSPTLVPVSTPPPTPGSLSLPQAIARLEGFGASPTNIPTSNNNPGDILFGEFAKKYGAVAGSESTDQKTGQKLIIAKFQDAETGFKAMQDLLRSEEYRSLTLAQTLTKWQGTNANVGEASRLTGIAPNAPIAPAVANTGQENPATQLQLAEQTIKLRQQAFDQIKALGLQPGNAVYDEAENKLAAASGGVQGKVAAELRRADQDQLSEMRLSAEETHKDHATELKDEETFIKSRLEAEKGYIANRKELRTELVAVLKQEETDRIQKETATAETLVTPEGKPDHLRRFDYWNQLAEDAKDTKDFSHAMEEAGRSGAEALRQANQDLKEADEEGLESLKRDHLVSIEEEVKYWQARLTADQFGGDAAAQALKQAADKLADAIQRLREQQREVARIEQEIAKIGIDSQFKKQEDVIEGASQLHVRSDSLGKQLGVSLPQVQKPSIATDVLSLGGSLGEGTHEAQQTAVIHQQEYESDRAALEKEKTLYQQGTKDYEDVKKREAQLDAKYDQQKLQDAIRIAKQLTQVWTHEIEQISQAFFRGLNQWIFGEKTFTQAMKQAWKDMVSSILQDLERWITKMIEEAVIMAVVKKLLDAMGLSAGGQQAQTAETVIQNEVLAQSYAGLAAATEFAYALSTSFGNLPYATAMGALALGIGEGFAAIASLDTGGQTKADGLAVLHKDEVVVRSPVTRMLEQMAISNIYSDRANVAPRNLPALGSHGSSPAPVTNLSQISNSSAGGDTHNHIHYNPNITNGDTRDFRKMLETHKDDLGRIVHRQSRTFNRG